MSSEHWKDWVIEQRQEYSQRKKSAHLIRESGSSSWATPNTMDHMAQRSPEALKRQFETTRKGRTQPANLREQVHPQNWPTATVFDTTGGSYPTEMVDGVYRSKHSQEPNSPWYGAKLKDAVESHEKNWPTVTARDWKGSGNATTRKDGKHRLDNLEAVIKYGHPDQANPNTSGNSQGSQQWATPRANKVHPVITEENRAHLANRKKSNLEEDIAGHCGKATGKLNPDWVEQLMGLPVGWTDLGFWATE
jgi:hypothetical protein